MEGIKMSLEAISNEIVKYAVAILKRIDGIKVRHPQQIREVAGIFSNVNIPSMIFKTNGI
jgi:hypothetical protein